MTEFLLVFPDVVRLWKGCLSVLGVLLESALESGLVKLVAENKKPPKRQILVSWTMVKRRIELAVGRKSS